MNLLSFDIEISDIFDLQPGEDLLKYAPFHISVAATSILGGEEIVWFSKDQAQNPGPNLSPEDARMLLDYLEQKQEEGYAVCAWNGLSFDLRWIGHAAEDMQRAARIALKSYDPMFQFFNIAGFPVGLAKVGQAMGVEQEKLMHGADAPQVWKDGNHQLVMDYCMGDCQITNLIVDKIRELGEVRWMTAKGYPSSKPMPRLMTVEEVIAAPPPDQSWMTTPMPKSGFYGWVVDAGVL